jgi:carboxylate-amine ligase
VLRGAALPRAFGSYAAYVEAVDALVRAGAVGDPESVEWDVRLRPADGALELTVMDAQTRVDEVAGLAALVQCLARVHAADGARRAVVIPEVLLHNRAAAAREGIRTADELAALVEECAPVARELGCSHELAGIRRNATDPGHARQRSITASAGLAGLVGSLVADFADAAATALAT